MRPCLFSLYLSITSSLLLAAGLAPVAAAQPQKLVARTYNSGFPQAHDTYNAMGAGTDGRIYYVLSSESIDVGAQMFVFDPRTKTIRHLGDLTAACGEQGRHAIPQGKSHVNFVECNGKLYFATHVGVYTIIDGMEKMGVPPPGYGPYPGGHLLTYELKTGRFEVLATAPDREGILAMNMDTNHGRIFCLTWPSGSFLRYDLARHELKDFGKQCAGGEDGKGAAYRTICRSICVDPQSGRAWFTTPEGAILVYQPATDSVERVAGEDMKKDYFGLYDPTSPGHMGYNWRQTVWYRPEKAVYGVHGNSGYLFKFAPDIPRLEVLERLTSEPSKRSGMFDEFSYGYLGFTLGPDGHTLHYLTGAPIYEHGKRLAGKSSTAMGEAKGLEDLHLITYDIPKAKYTDRGAIFYQNGQRPLYVNSIAVSKNGNVYFLARITENGRTRADLVEVPKTWR